MNPRSRSRHRYRASALAALMLAACAPPGPLDPDATPGGPLLRIEGPDGGLTPRDAMARVPSFVFRFGLQPPLGESVWLLRGAPDAELLQDATRAPLRLEHRERAVALRVQPLPQADDGGPPGVRATPLSPLSPGAVYTLLLARWAVADPDRVQVGGAILPWAVALRVSSAPDAGAAAVASAPADGATRVPTNLGSCNVAFDGALDPSHPPLRLHSSAGQPVAADVQRFPCAARFSEAAECWSLRPGSPLQPHAEYILSLAVDARDHRGGGLPGWSARFRTAGGPDAAPPTLRALPCTVDEQPAGPLCVVATDHALTVRLAADEPVWVHSRLLPDGPQGALSAPRGTATLRLSRLHAATVYRLQLALTDSADQRRDFEFALATQPPLATLSLTEVRSNPRGPEPDQEYAELYNYGPVAIDIGGCGLSDAPDAAGTVLPSARIEAGAAALLVPADFDPDAPADLGVPPGTQLVVLPGPLGKGGLSNRGEPLLLRDPAGRRLSATPSQALAAGECLVRRQATGDDPRSDAPDRFDVLPEDLCSPGWVEAAPVPAPDAQP